MRKNGAPKSLSILLNPASRTRHDGGVVGFSIIGDTIVVGGQGQSGWGRRQIEDYHRMTEAGSSSRGWRIHRRVGMRPGPSPSDSRVAHALPCMSTRFVAGRPGAAGVHGERCIIPMEQSSGAARVGSKARGAKCRIHPKRCMRHPSLIGFPTGHDELDA